MAFSTCGGVVNGINYAEGKDDQKDPLMGHGRQEVAFYLVLRPLKLDVNEVKSFTLVALSASSRL